jgi:WD40 repeat protein
VEDALNRAVQASRARLTLSGHTQMVRDVSFSPDGKQLATASLDGTAKIWDATASWDGTAKLWDTFSSQELRTLRGHRNGVGEVAFSPNGKQLATAGGDGTAKLWDASSGQELFTLVGHTNMLNTVIFSPDGTRLATASWDRTARVWDASSGRELSTLSHTREVMGVAFSPDGTRLATASADRTVRVYVLNIEDLIVLAQTRVTRSLTLEECQKYLHLEQCPPTP